MGMTIDGIKQELMKILAFAVSESQYNAVKNALIIINKYQKIEQIISDGYLQGKSNVEILLGIMEIMNGNNTD